MDDYLSRVSKPQPLNSSSACSYWQTEFFNTSLKVRTTCYAGFGLQEDHDFSLVLIFPVPIYQTPLSSKTL